MLVAANQLPERQRTAIHVRIHREPMQWAARLASLSERQFKRRYRMPKHAFAQAVDGMPTVQVYIHLRHCLRHCDLR